MTRRKKQKTSHLTKGELSQAEIWDDSALIRSWNDAVAEYEYYHSIHARGEDVEEILRKAEMGELDDENTDADVDMGGQWRPVHPETPADTATAAAAAAADENETTADAGARDTRSESGEVADEDDPEGSPDGLEQRRKAAMDQFKSLLDEPEGQQKHPPRSTLEQPSTTTTTAPTIGPSLPPTSAIENVQVPPTATPAAPATSLSPDQTLENIKMAYYWAGYYSGLYDGQRQRQAQHAQAQGQPPAKDATGDQQ
ncbi:hypothetical protein AYO20_03461 [Fonsecaea nubica]|uniref:Survival Motor Neuron Gemin2-binding domain-containing protein n=1 Tax=Fonsecaea nubica TaxID=856822 RepID=A0A178D847_9EURO|nr:hypothetical protein AYO20_03461 [Fonsecaea nubica]OAL37285.1 hypothetical protein AYO20_03461 [Fonsecaea nubica]